MPLVRKYSMVLLALVFAFSSASFADVDKDKDKRKKTRSEIAALKAKFAGLTADCNLGSASADLDINNVKARVFNNGGLFWIGGSPIYEVPKGSGQNAIFASGIWVGGLVDGSIRAAAATYSDWEFWPGPLDATGQAPDDCAEFDRIYRVNRQDIRNFQNTGAATPDILEWPWELGAPVEDGDGNPDNYDLEGGDLPGILGDQTLWWVMNDAGNTHLTTETPPIGLEVQVTAFAFNQAGALGNSTFYKYKFIYKGVETLTDVYLGLWSDPDLGDAADDYVGSDSLLGLGFVMNGDDFDGGSSGYGDRPPALGYDFFQGALVDNDGVDNNRDGTVDEPGERVAMAKFVFYNNNSTDQGNPTNAEEYYGYLAGEWRNGDPITFGGTGLGFSETPANYMFPADPPEFWSEDQPTPGGDPNVPSDRRFLQSAGPFTMSPGDVQEIVFGITWAQAADRISSVTFLKAENAKAQNVFDIDFDVPPVPDAPIVNVEALDGKVILNWELRPTDNDYFEEYSARSINVVDPLARDTTYDFEGYVVLQFDSPADNEGELIGTYDKINRVFNVFEDIVDPQTGLPRRVVLAKGRDTGIQRSHLVEGLVNNREYYFGVQAYAYNESSNPQWYPSAITRVTVAPTATRTDGQIITSEKIGERPAAVFAGNGFDLGVNVQLQDPSLLHGTQYTVEFYEEVNGKPNYDVFVTQPNRERRFSGAEYFQRFEKVAIGQAAVYVDGLRVNVNLADEFRWFNDLYTNVYDGGPRPIQREFFMTSQLELDGGGNVVPKAYQPAEGTVVRMYSVGDGTAEGDDCFGLRTNDVLDPDNPTPTATKSCFTGDFDGDAQPDTVRAITEVAGPGGADPCADGSAQCISGERVVDFPFFSSDGLWTMPILTTQSFDGLHEREPNTFEIRFTAVQDPAFLGNLNCPTFGCGSVNEHIFTTGDGTFVPYEVWDIGNVRPGEANDPADDVRMLPSTFSDNGGELLWAMDELVGDDIGVPATWGASDRIYAYYPDCFSDGRSACLDGSDPRHTYDGPGGYLDQVTAVISGPVLPGDVFTVDVADLTPVQLSDEEVRRNLDRITIVPNPYLGASDYEVSRVTDVARITNLPTRATIRIFTLNGTLIRTLEKSGATSFVNWDLNTDEGLPIASGIYLIHVEAKDEGGATMGERILKFAAVKKKVQLNEL